MSQLRGAYVAIVTPFLEEKLDEQGLRDLLDFHLENGTHGIVPCGTTGESATLSFAEHHRVIEVTIQKVGGRLPVMAGTGSNSTDEAIELTQFAKDAGADSVLSVVPYYNKPSQEGLYRHFKKIAETVDIPLVLYNVPGRTVTNMLPETVARLAQIDNIVGIKEASTNLSQITDVLRLCPPDFAVLSGDDFTCFPSVFLGCTGVISVTANVMPREMSAFMEAALAGNLEEAKQLHFRLFPMFHAMFAAPNPVPAKKALELLGKIRSGEARLPLSPIDDKSLAQLQEAMRGCGLEV